MVLARLAHNLTICARATYEPQTENILALFHVVVRQRGSTLPGIERRCPGKADWIARSNSLSEALPAGG